MMTLTAMSLSLSLSLLGASPGAPDGKALFTSKRCTMCHSVVSEDIKAPADTKMTIVDLSGLSTKRKADWLKAYLEKKEKLDGKAHPARFKGDAAELEALSNWMATIKPAP